MSNIRTIIERLGYDKSENLYCLMDIEKCDMLSWHSRRVLASLAPYAVYVVEGNVLVAFFDDLHMRKDTEVQCKIWNAQIPIIVSDEGNRVNIYSGKSMKLDGEEKVQLSCVDNYKFEQCNEKNNFSYWNVTNSMMLEMYESSLSKKSLNEFLIDNLKTITKKLREKYNISFANKFVLRILFIRYLIDRGVNIGYKGLAGCVKEAQCEFLSIVTQKDELYQLFSYLKKKFNGNLFEMEIEKEKREISDAALSMVHDFLTGKQNMQSGQLCLFPYYDFNIIPIELISNIYEILLGKKKQDKDKAFYTPEYLVDYIVDRTVGVYLEKNDSCSVFDPSCGSGIFLVKSLRRLLDKASMGTGYIRDKDKINRIVQDCIFGVDYNEEAVDVTIFSVYVTLFDYQDPKKLDDFRLPLLKGKNILYGDFFDDEILKAIRNRNFIFILGNPPWGKVDQERYKKYCKAKNITPQDGEICIAFLLRVQEFGGMDTECSLVIPSKILYKGKRPSCVFRNKLLSDTTIRQVLEISAVRKQIFKGATAPAAVVSFLCKEPEKMNKVEYISLKPNKYLRLFGIIMIEPDDIKYVEQNFLRTHDTVWKSLVYGSYWDFALIESLKRKNPTIGSIIRDRKMKKGKGLETHLGDGQDSTKYIGRKILDAKKSIQQFQISVKSSSLFSKSRIHRVRREELFEPPYVLFMKGLDCENYSIKSVYTEEKLLYQSTISCIKGSMEDKEILLNLEGLLNSSLFTYLNFMLGSSVGVEREQIFLNELIEFPYIYSEELTSLVKKKHQEIEAGKPDKNDISKQINLCVMKMYGVEGNPFVDYALNVTIPLLCGNYVEEKCDLRRMKDYAETFVKIWDERLERTGISYSITMYPNIKEKFAAFKMKLSYDENDNSIRIVNDVDDFDVLTELMIYKLNDCFYQAKNIFQYEENSFVIVKSIEMKNWHPAMAIKDSHKVLNTVLLGKEDWV